MTMEKKRAAYGAWKSPLSGDAVAKASIRLSELSVTSSSVFWGEVRPNEGGRTAIVEWHEGERFERLASPWNVRTRVHEYGGGAMVASNRDLYFSHFSDGRVYGQAWGKAPVALTPEIKGPRVGFADLKVDRNHNRLIAVRESHREDGEPTAALVSISLAPLSGGLPKIDILAQGEDFYASPAISPDGRHLAWLTWSHPNMPWDGTELWLADMDDKGHVGTPALITGSQEESIFQPGFDTEGHLIFATDRSDWWHLVRKQKADFHRPEVEPEDLTPIDAEFGLPQWVFGMSTWVEFEPGKLASAYTQNGQWYVGRVADGAVTTYEVPYSTIDAIRSDGKGNIYFIGGSPTKARELVSFNPTDDSTIRILNETQPLPLEDECVSCGVPVSFPSADQRLAHAFFYAPQNNRYAHFETESPPLIVKIHGGPTGCAGNAFDPGIQFWTTRGFAVVDVNYGGSTGYGRAYRETLKGNWGIVDVEDCVAAAEYLSKNGHVDPKRRAIRGGSAGGYTTLAALAFTDAFQAGASHFGVADLEALARDTHKFESRYLDGLVGPYPERKDLYQARAPLNSAHKIQCPVIFFQGLEDKVVPPNQAELMVAALNENNIPNEYITFEGEGHGFRRAENIVTALETELRFYQQTFGLTDP